MKSIAIAFVLVVSACGRSDGDIDDLVGARCVDDRDCDNRCLRDSGDYPGGFCSIQCNSDDDCTTDSSCIAKDDGVCLFDCPAFDCARLGPGWACKEKDRAGGGKITVCVGD